MTKLCALVCQRLVPGVRRDDDDAVVVDDGSESGQSIPEEMVSMVASEVTLNVVGEVEEVFVKNAGTVETAMKVERIRRTSLGSEKIQCIQSYSYFVVLYEADAMMMSPGRSTVAYHL